MTLYGEVQRQYTDEEKSRAIVEYSVVGNITRVAETLGMPDRTLATWIKTDWGQAQLDELRQLATVKMGAVAEDIYFKATDQVKKELHNATAIQAATIGAMYFDKRRLANNEPTSIKGNKDSIEDMCEVFRKVAQRHGQTYEIVNKPNDIND